MIVNARPMMNPFSTGSEMKFAKNPNRNSPATNASSPTVIASAADRAAKRPPPTGTSVPTVAADSNAAAAIGPTIS